MRYRDYVERKLASQALDYDDLLLYWHAMMGDVNLAAEIGARVDHVLVDEYQGVATRARRRACARAVRAARGRRGPAAVDVVGAGAVRGPA